MTAPIGTVGREPACAGPGDGPAATVGAKANKERQDHHFAPCFYLRRWSSSSRKILCEFSVPHDVVKPRRTSPSGTGYVTLLYGLDEEGLAERNRLETDFYRPVDTRAADALAAIEGGVDNAIAPVLRTAWTRFMMSLMMRMPADMATLARSYRVEFAHLTPWQKRRWAEVRRPGWPAKMSEAIERLTPGEAADQAKELATRLMENERITAALAAMHWRALDVSPAAHPLLTSDRPLRLSGILRDPRTELVLPIGPHRLFVAGHDRRHVDGIAARGADRLVARSNRAVVEAADDYVWGVDDGQLDFVRRHFGRNRPKSQLERLVEHMESKRGGHPGDRRTKPAGRRP